MNTSINIHPSSILARIYEHQPLMSTSGKGRQTRVDDIVTDVIEARSQNLFTQMLPFLQEGQSFLTFTGGGSILLAESLYKLVSTKRNPQSFLIVPRELASVLNAIGGYILAQTTAQKLLERMNPSATQPR